MKSVTMPFAVAAVLSSGCAVGSQEVTDPIPTSACELIREPSVFNGKLVTLEAIVKPSSHYSTILMDPQCESRTIALVIPAELYDRDSSVGEIIDSIFKGYPFAPDYFAGSGSPVSVTGKFELKPGVPAWLITARSISRIHRTPTAR